VCEMLLSNCVVGKAVSGLHHVLTHADFRVAVNLVTCKQLKNTRCSGCYTHSCHILLVLRADVYFWDISEKVQNPKSFSFGTNGGRQSRGSLVTQVHQENGCQMRTCIGVASYGALGHVSHSTSNDYFFQLTLELHNKISQRLCAVACPNISVFDDSSCGRHSSVYYFVILYATKRFYVVVCPLAPDSGETTACALALKNNIK